MPKITKKTEKLLNRMAKTLQDRLTKVDSFNNEVLPDGLIPMSTILTPGKVGNVQIQTYEVSPLKAQLYNLRQALGNTPQMAITPGTYTRLMVGKELMMSDAPMEARSNKDIIDAARGDVLIAGLGLGMVLIPILLKPSVMSVTVVEKYNGVIKLVWPQLKKWRDEQKTGVAPAPLMVEWSDIHDWEPLSHTHKFDVIYFDIWPTISPDNLPEGMKLKTRFRKYLKPKGWIGIWVENEMRKRKRLEAKLMKELKARRRK